MIRSGLSYFEPPFMSQLYIPSLFISAQLTPTLSADSLFSLLLALEEARLKALICVHLSLLNKISLNSN